MDLFLTFDLILSLTNKLCDSYHSSSLPTAREAPIALMKSDPFSSRKSKHDLLSSAMTKGNRERCRMARSNSESNTPTPRLNPEKGQKVFRRKPAPTRRRSSPSKAKASYEPLDKRHVAAFTFLLLPFFEPGVVSAFSPEFDTLFRIAKTIAFVVIFALFVWRHRLDAMSACTIALALAMLISCLPSESSMRFYVSQWLPLATIVLLASWASPTRLRELAYAAMILTAVLSLLNLCTIIAFPQGTYGTLYTPMSDHYFYGHRNLSYHFIFISVGSSWLLDSSQNRTFSPRTIALLILGVVQIWLAFSATTFVALSIGVILAVLASLKRTKGIVNGLALLIGYIAAFVALVCFRINEHLGFLITGILCKSTSLTGRTEIWDQAIRQMDPSHLLFGYGLDGQRIVLDAGQRVPHPHNEILTFWTCGGIVCAALFLAILSLACLALFKNRKECSSRILCVILACFLVVSLTETILHCSFWIVIALAYYWRRDYIAICRSDDCNATERLSPSSEVNP